MSTIESIPISGKRRQDITKRVRPDTSGLAGRKDEVSAHDKLQMNG